MLKLSGPCLIRPINLFVQDDGMQSVGFGDRNWGEVTCYSLRMTLIIELATELRTSSEL